MHEECDYRASQGIYDEVSQWLDRGSTGIFVNELMFIYIVIAPILAQHKSPIDLELEFVGTAKESFCQLVVDTKLDQIRYPIHLTSPWVLKILLDAKYHYTYKNDQTWKGFEKGWEG